jgi:hypothetical protein
LQVNKESFEKANLDKLVRAKNYTVENSCQLPI